MSNYPDVYRASDTVTGVTAGAWSALQDLTVEHSYAFIQRIGLYSDQQERHSIAIYRGDDGDATDYSDSDLVHLEEIVCVEDPSATAYVGFTDVQIPFLVEGSTDKIWWKVKNGGASTGAFRVDFYWNPAPN